MIFEEGDVLLSLFLRKIDLVVRYYLNRFEVRLKRGIILIF